MTFKRIQLTAQIQGLLDIKTIDIYKSNKVMRKGIEIRLSEKKVTYDFIYYSFLTKIDYI